MSLHHYRFCYHFHLHVCYSLGTKLHLVFYVSAINCFHSLLIVSPLFFWLYLFHRFFFPVHFFRLHRYFLPPPLPILLPPSLSSRHPPNQSSLPAYFSSPYSSLRLSPPRPPLSSLPSCLLLRPPYQVCGEREPMAEWGKQLERMCWRACEQPSICLILEVFDPLPLPPILPPCPACPWPPTPLPLPHRPVLHFLLELFLPQYPRIFVSQRKVLSRRGKVCVFIYFSFYHLFSLLLFSSFHFPSLPFLCFSFSFHIFILIFISSLSSLISYFLFSSLHISFRPSLYSSLYSKPASLFFPPSFLSQFRAFYDMVQDLCGKVMRSWEYFR